ncbi:helix-turn-helix transcriptional regulator [Paracrocinitomix mangrovi]|uniref:helix-turn-helix domain-containing protein n=1 Tax=Paracrocinitomix mangrovi TaxID=2862509 RepID=UPI001C8D720D|nr:response regulator transcription factor [Paracrocinitomix mangrovi]UKN00438.1 helix-turn-helix transcriptional regulator [Paracrocinitomix mangrovi]
MSEIMRIETIGQMVQLAGFRELKHPLVYTLDIQDFKIPNSFENVKLTTGFYSIFMKDANCAIQYGRNTYDFEEGVLSFFAPGQVTTINSESESKNGWALFFHPDLIRKSALGKNIDNFHFFSYDVHEALHLSKKEEDILNDCIKKIEFELEQNIDAHSQNLLISNIELLLNYCQRFYERQFHSRSDHHKDVVTTIEEEIKLYFEQNFQIDQGIPTTKYLADKVNLSPNYLGDMLKKETGKNTKEHINDFVVEKAKNLLLGSSNNVSEIAYELGFNYPHYFSRLFKQKTGVTPQKYRELNN